MVAISRINTLTTREIYGIMRVRISILSYSLKGESDGCYS